MENDYSDITFRLLDLSDADDFMEWYSDEKVSEFCSWNTFTSKQAAMQYVADNVIPHPWYKAICLKNKPIGSISVTPFSGYDICRAELGYVLGSKYWGKGIVTTAVKMAAASVFVEWPHLERLEAVVAVENMGSQRVLEKAGFTREGVLRKYYLLKGKPKDAVIFSLLSTDPQVNYLMYD
ncbi:Acyl-CoA N-acyltransferase (NAT) superfamily protein [Forsythia ovata]|uniref:Acyl-CoA N-acyltransferase (NAT) superfamily protein n=1 Tax=Forsythia ovata TaxID=205694 RepID=A0ABD1PJ13_9LAMI